MDKQLSERKRRILQAIVEAHIAYGEPVGSKYLAQAAALSCSPATIRNEMADLEEMGYLEQPHTSAGRIPSEKGYRLYVDDLRRHYRMAAEEIAEIGRTLRYKLNEVDAILSDASRLASAFTHYTSIAVKPRPASVRVERYESMYIDPRNLVLVMLFHGGVVKTKYVRLDVDMAMGELPRVTALLNRYLINLTSDRITPALIRALENEAGHAACLVLPIVRTVCEAMNELDGGDVKVQGVERLLDYREYADVDHMKDMLSMFEHKDALLDLVASGADEGQDVHVYIGRENSMDVMSHSTLVYRQIRQGGKLIGAIGVIGPCRMDYSKVIETLNQLADGIGHVIDGEENE